MLPAEGVELLRVRLGPLGIWTLGFEGMSPGEVRRAAGRLEQAGSGSIWFGESVGREAFTQASLLLEATLSQMVGTGIASIHRRRAGACAAASTLLATAHEDRFILGLGASHAPLVARQGGQPEVPPLAAMRQYLDALDGVTLRSIDASRTVPRILAALGPKMLDLSAERADGAITYLATPDHTRVARERLGPSKLLVVHQAFTVAEDVDTHRERAARQLNRVLALENYRRSWRRQGYEDADLVAGGSPRLRDALVPRGTKAAAERIHQHLAAGADHVVAEPVGPEDLRLPVDDAVQLLRSVPLALTPHRC